MVRYETRGHFGETESIDMYPPPKIGNLMDIYIKPLNNLRRPTLRRMPSPSRRAPVASHSRTLRCSRSRGLGRRRRDRRGLDQRRGLDPWSHQGCRCRWNRHSNCHGKAGGVRLIIDSWQIWEMDSRM